MRYAVVIEKAARNYSAYVPDVPGCVATGKSVAQTLSNLREALVMHFEGMRADGETVPDPTTLCDYIDLKVSRASIRKSA
jgi:predicted RNase H-like HicB family nuclease